MKQIKDVTTSDIFSHWINIAYLPRWGVLLLDLFIVFVAFIISIIIGNNLWGYSFPSLYKSIRHKVYYWMLYAQNMKSLYLDKESGIVPLSDFLLSWGRKLPCVKTPLKLLMFLLRSPFCS